MLRKIYRVRGITRQKVVNTFMPRVEPFAKQMDVLLEMKTALMRWVMSGKHPVFVDECTFQAKSLQLYEWAPQGKPLTYNRHNLNTSVVAVIGAVS